MPSERTRKKISRTDSPEVRFWANVRKTRGCWLWIGATRRRGYGKIRVHGPQVAAHRFSYEMAYGPIPSGHFVCHRCDNPRCVRPDHLFAGTRMENMHDMVRKGRGVNPVAVARRALTHCVHGHPFDEANTYHPPGRNVRKCRACAREQKRRQYQQARAA